MSCLFCRIIAGEIPATKIAETDPLDPRRFFYFVEHIGDGIVSDSRFGVEPDKRVSALADENVIAVGRRHPL